MKHHEYSIYIGGKKRILKEKYCEDCQTITPFPKKHYAPQPLKLVYTEWKKQPIIVRSHKK